MVTAINAIPKSGVLSLILIGLILISSISCKKEASNEPAPVKDIDGNIYHEVTIGAQVWMVENLKTTKYRNGEPITNITAGIEWRNQVEGSFCWYNNEASYKNVYGALYNWHAVNDSRNIAPAGWHVASNAEWVTLVNFLGGGIIADGKLKETGNIHWLKPSVTANNQSGFTALPGGYRGVEGSFSDLGLRVSWWCSDDDGSASAQGKSMVNDASNVLTVNTDKTAGYSVRCIKN